MSKPVVPSLFRVTKFGIITFGLASNKRQTSRSLGSKIPNSIPLLTFTRWCFIMLLIADHAFSRFKVFTFFQTKLRPYPAHWQKFRGKFVPPQHMLASYTYANYRLNVVFFCFTGLLFWSRSGSVRRGFLNNNPWGLHHWSTICIFNILQARCAFRRPVNNDASVKARRLCKHVNVNRRVRHIIQLLRLNSLSYTAKSV